MESTGPGFGISRGGAQVTKCLPYCSVCHACAFVAGAAGEKLSQGACLAATGPVWLRPISFFCCSAVTPRLWRGVVPPRLCVGVVAFLSAAFPGACLATTTLLLFYCCSTVTPRLWGGVVAFLSAASPLELHGQFVCTRFPSPTTLWLAFWACVFQ